MAFLLMPFVIVIGASFDSSNQFAIQFPPHNLSLARYTEIDPKYLISFFNSAFVAAVVSIFSAAIGLAASLGVTRGRLIGREIVKSFFRLPVQIPLIVTGAVFLQFYSWLGAATGLYPARSLAGIIIAHLLVAIPYAIGATTAVLERIDPAVEEAAQSLGASGWSVFRSVTFPMIRPGVAVGIFYAFAVSFGDVPIAIFLVRPETMTLPVEVFNDMQVDFQPSILALSTLVICMSLAMMILIQKVVGLDFVLSPRQRS
jgi:putative spermidine/putrescine transport system permease protein